MEYSLSFDDSSEPSSPINSIMSRFQTGLPSFLINETFDLTLLEINIENGIEMDMYIGALTSAIDKPNDVYNVIEALERLLQCKALPFYRKSDTEFTIADIIGYAVGGLSYMEERFCHLLSSEFLVAHLKGRAYIEEEDIKEARKKFPLAPES